MEVGTSGPHVFLGAVSKRLAARPISRPAPPPTILSLSVTMVASSKSVREPLKYSGTLDSYEYFEVTPCLGREYPKLSIRDILNAPNSDDMIRDFAVITSTRLVVFLRTGNDNLTLQEQKKFTHRLGLLTGKPKESG